MEDGSGSNWKKRWQYQEEEAGAVCMRISLPPPFPSLINAGSDLRHAFLPSGEDGIPVLVWSPLAISQGTREDST